MLKKQEILSINIAIVGVIALAIGVFIGWFKLSDILNYLPQIIIPSIVGILILGFRQRIWNKLFPNSKDSEEFTKFSDLINYATESLDICAITSTLMILQHSNVIKKSIRKGIKFTFLLFDKYSEHLDTYNKILENSEDLENEIITSMKRLCKMKKNLILVI